MSGIAGIMFAGRERAVPQGLLRNMGKEIARSQESSDIAVWEEGSLGLVVHRQQGRHAGMGTRGRNGSTVALVFFGSLYNLREFVPPSAEPHELVEALLDLYEKQGMEFLHRLRGEFIAGVWDGPRETLHVATDRFRIFPLLYYVDQEKLVFASHMRALYAAGLSSYLSIDPQAVVDFMVSSFIPTPKTIFREVRKLPPGSILSYRQGRVSIHSYWDMNYLTPLTDSKTELVQQLKYHFKDALSVRYEGERIPSEVGTFLSGGVDSSTVTGVLAQLSRDPVNSFSIGFGEDRFNEISYARTAAQAFGSKHYEYFVSAQDTIDLVSTLTEAFDEPFANASAVPTYYCARLAANHRVNVLYAGDGGDEIFSGNERYAKERVFEYYDKVPLSLRRLFVRPLVFLLADRLGGALFTKAKKYIMRASIPYPERLCSYGFLKVIPQEELFDNALLEAIGVNYDPDGDVKRYYHAARANTELDRQMYIDLKLAIADNDLLKVTRMAEQAGTIVRFPFLDHHLAEFSANIPADVRMKGRALRSFFKEAYADILPQATLTKEKHGFGLPIPLWLKTNRVLTDMTQDLVASSRSLQRGYFKKAGVGTMLKRHQEDGTSYYGTAVWNLLVLELWHRAYRDAGKVWCA
jgi:asparagine synthase (glutamine-hydrolysing)